jgi:hypothetical protein
MQEMLGLQTSSVTLCRLLSMFHMKLRLRVLEYWDKGENYVVSDRLCGLVVRVPGYRSRGSGSIYGATRLSE